MARYPKITDGEWVNPHMPSYNMSCCDCGLVHNLKFKVDKSGQVWIRVRRNNRATGQIRRRMFKEGCIEDCS
jgi:hypothetical protein